MLLCFDYGNSPSQIENVDFSDKVVIHTTSCGTQGIVNDINADGIITGSFVNASAIVKYIKQSNY
jgi:2-phosphosulfolactate phosphatase